VTDDPTGRVFDALADPNRRYVVEALAQRPTATATELAAELPVTRQAVSKHLAALGEAGLVEGHRQGRETRYRLTPGPLGQAMDWMAEVGADWDTRLGRLRDHLSGGSRSGGASPRRRRRPR
jgi:DNA-binding transcriptional ArsR family regulator